jgi:hypothetical protein
MRRFSLWRFTRFASLLRTTILLCLGVFLLSWPAGGSEVSAAFTMTSAAHAEQASNGDGCLTDDYYYLAVFVQESEAEEKLPKNAALLRALVFVLFFGPVLWWLAASGWMRCRQEVCRGWFHSMVHVHQRRGVATLLGVFLL